MLPIESYLDHIKSPLIKDGIIKFHLDHLELFNKAKGSESKHQAWEGGYRCHLEQCMCLAFTLYCTFERNFSFSTDSVIQVLYFHDIEKMWKYTTGITIDKKTWYETIPLNYGLKFTDEEKNALQYIHGEGEDYSDQRVMNELAGFCHACDVISARTFHNIKEFEFKKLKG